MKTQNFDTKIVSIAHSKGGVGKSTLTILLARGMHEIFKKKICILDCDYQGSIMKQYAGELAEGADRDAIGIDVMSVKPENIFSVLETVYGKYDIVFLDMPRITDQGDEEILKYYYNTNFIIIPLLVGNSDLLAIGEFLQIAEAIKESRNEQGVDFDFYGIGNINDGSADYRYLYQDAGEIGLPTFETQIKDLHILKKISFTSNLFNKKVGQTHLTPVIEEFNKKLKGEK